VVQHVSDYVKRCCGIIMLQAVSPQVSAVHTHHRTKSSPDTLNVQNMSLAEGKSLVAVTG
jgi:hypothetical protein